jgi:transglutaminase-like putative cysteine protease
VTFPSHLPGFVPVPNPGGLANPSLGADDPARRDGRDRGGRASFGYFGFSSTLDTSVRGRPDNTLVMRVKTARPDLWRGQSFDTWDGTVWSNSDDREVPVFGDPPLQLPVSVGESKFGPPVVQTFLIDKPGPNLVFGAAMPAKLYIADRQVFALSDGTVRTGVQLTKGTVYTVVSNRAAVTSERLRAVAVEDAPAEIADRYTRLPRVSGRVGDLAREVTAGAASQYDQVLALEAWMAANTQYTLDIPPLPAGSDAVDQFLFVDRKGFCEQIGSSLVVMLRSLGIPARLAVGYAPGQRNPFTGLYEVRAKHAHAWAEVWFPEVGWQSFDPTASVPLAGGWGMWEER